MQFELLLVDFMVLLPLSFNRILRGNLNPSGNPFDLIACDFQVTKGTHSFNIYFCDVDGNFSSFSPLLIGFSSRTYYNFIICV